MEGSVRYAVTQGIIGTPAYMSPEAEQGIVCKEADIYSMGCCLYEMLSGGPPFSETPTVWDKVNKAFPPLTSKVPGLPPHIDQIKHNGGGHRIAAIMKVNEAMTELTRAIAYADGHPREDKGK